MFATEAQKMSVIALNMRLSGSLSFASVRARVLARAKKERAKKSGNARNWAGCKEVELILGDGSSLEAVSASLASSASPLGPALAKRSFGEREWVLGGEIGYGEIGYANASREIFKRDDIIDLNDRSDELSERLGDLTLGVRSGFEKAEKRCPVCGPCEGGATQEPSQDDEITDCM